MAFCYGVAALWPLPLDEEHILNVAPLFHIWGFCYTLIFPVYLRAFMVLLPAYKPVAVWRNFRNAASPPSPADRRRCTWAFAPTKILPTPISPACTFVFRAAPPARWS